MKYLYLLSLFLLLTSFNISGTTAPVALQGMGYSVELSSELPKSKVNPKKVKKKRRKPKAKKAWAWKLLAIGIPVFGFLALLIFFLTMRKRMGGSRYWNSWGEVLIVMILALVGIILGVFIFIIISGFAINKSIGNATKFAEKNPLAVANKVIKRMDKLKERLAIYQIEENIKRTKKELRNSKEALFYLKNICTQKIERIKQELEKAKSSSTVPDVIDEDDELIEGDYDLNKYIQKLEKEIRKYEQAIQRIDDYTMEDLY